MRMEILGREKTLAHVPQEQTYGIRIGFSGYCSKKSDVEDFKELENHPLYVPHVYHFDDVEPLTCEKYERPITRDIAIQIIRDFEQGKGGCSMLLVHCEEGQSRGPAVAMALNHIFKLGATNRELAKKYPHFNLHVAKTLGEVAEANGYGIFQAPC